MTEERPHQNPVEVFQFDKSLKELKDLRSQLHYAADYCESSFLNSKKRDQVMKNTKEYICRAVVTVVDHLGSASANFDKIISQDKTVPEAELRLDCLSQRMLACKKFTHQSALAELCWNPNLPRHRSRYLLAELPNHGQNLVDTDDVKVANNIESEVKRSEHPEGGMDSFKAKSDDVVPKWPKVQGAGFEFQHKNRKVARRSKLVRVSLSRSSDLLSFIRGTKRMSKVN
ncbi:unnamed protein product [Rhodiola kirilowii]